MTAKYELGTYGGLRFNAPQSVVYWMAALWALIAVAAMVLLKPPVIEAVVGGLVCAIIHMLLEVAHQFGHAWAARRTGYPMKGVQFWWILSRSIYPSDEPELPGRIHVRRALGGPIASGLLCIPLAVVALLVQPWTQTPGWIAAFAFLDGLLVFFLGAFLPLGFTDGSTLLRWWGK